MTEPSKPRRNDKAVKIRRVLAVKAGVIAESKGLTIAEYLSRLLESPIEKDWAKVVDSLDKDSQ